MIFAYLIVLQLSILAVSAEEQPTVTDAVKADATIEYTQTSPIWLANVKIPYNVVRGYPYDEEIKTGTVPEKNFIDMSAYPEPNKQPPTNHPEVQAVLKHLDFTKMGNAPVRLSRGWALNMTGYSVPQDPDCWWSASICKKPKLSYIPEDIANCPQKGHWGLNYDDGPFKYNWPKGPEDKIYDQPRFYNFLIDKANRQKATLFFVGSNVIKHPHAAQRALNDGHTICSHTWSHPQMTTLTNEEVVAQLYWTQKAIKETMGITPKCWRPPYGDVDDRVRAIAWQMGMRTILWDQDSNDWNLNNGNIKAEMIDSYFDKWIKQRVNNNDTDHGHITLEHDNSNITILMSEKWLPKIQQAFKVMPIHQCINEPQPYWEESFVYPTLNNPDPPRSKIERNPNVEFSPDTSSAATLNADLFVLLCTIIISCFHFILD